MNRRDFLAGAAAAGAACLAPAAIASAAGVAQPPVFAGVDLASAADASAFVLHGPGGKVLGVCRLSQEPGGVVRVIADIFAEHQSVYGETMELLGWGPVESLEQARVS